MKYLMNAPEFIERRRCLRKSQTDAERKMWSMLRSRRFGNLKFRRQFSIGSYILDFYCPEKKLCIELDGGQHALRSEYDRERTIFLNERGVTVIRFWNNDVLKNLEGVYEELSRKINTSPQPSPNLGEGVAVGRAFTLVELLVVIAVIGLLGTIAVVSTNSARIKARDAKRSADLRQIRNAVEFYYQTNNKYPGVPTYYWIDDNNEDEGNGSCAANPNGLKPYLPNVCNLKDSQGNHYAYSVDSTGNIYHIGAMFELSANQGVPFIRTDTSAAIPGYYEPK
jgi:prepilin-type N-terminal cleavage/methylation domain-containing protein